MTNKQIIFYLNNECIRYTPDRTYISLLEFLRLNLMYSHKCQTRKLFSTGYKVGTQEYKNCILNKGKKINE